MPKGVKTCPQCKKNCGPRTKIHECGFVFEIKSKATTKAQKHEVEISPEISTPSKVKDGLLVYYAVGPCPIKLKSKEDSIVLSWCKTMEEYSFVRWGQKYKYAKSAILRFVEQFFKNGRKNIYYLPTWKLVHKTVKERPGECLVNM